jgi:hypothetical protein
VHCEQRRPGRTDRLRTCSAMTGLSSLAGVASSAGVSFGLSFDTGSCQARSHQVG